MLKQDLVNRLAAQGINGKHLLESCFDLEKAGVLKSNDQVNAREAISIIVASTKPCCASTGDYVLRTLNYADQDGCHFGEVLQGLLEANPAKPQVASIHISATWAEIRYLNGNIRSFDSKCKPAGIRRETILSGGLFSALQTNLHNPTVSGWVEQ